MDKRALILYVGYGDGHKKAAEAIEESLKKKGIKTLSKDMGETYPFIKRNSEKVYLQMIHYFPFIWRFMHASKKAEIIIKPIFKILYSLNKRKYEKVIKEFRPDVIVCSFAFCAGVVSTLNLKIPLVGAATDHHMHSYWINKKIDKYLVGNEETKKSLVKKKIDAEKIRVAGIPIRKEFFSDKKVKKSSLGLKEKIPAIMIMGGSLGIGPLKNIAEELEESDINMQVLVMAGKNQKLKKEIKETGKVKVLGYKDNIYDYMKACDLLITKPSGLTTTEAIASGIPMVLMKAIPGQEEKNVPYLLSKGAAVRGNLKVVETLIKEKDLYNFIVSQQRKTAKTYSTQKAADYIEEMIK